jgi:uncharacterized protein
MSELNPVFRINGISYLEIPAVDVAKSSSFYHDVFRWKIRDDPKSPAFEDGTGHVIGHWKSDLAPVGQAGIMPYIYVSSVNETLEKIRTRGGKVVKDSHSEGDLLVASFLDPAGNLIGIWQKS